jgi:DsbC/DsbD-like thiol-disulfide interchange protein
MQTVAVGLTALAVAGAVLVTHRVPAPTAQSASGKAPADLTTRYLKVRLGPSDPVAMVAAPGQRLTLTLDVTPGAKMHLYAPGQKGYVPIAIELDASKDFKAAPAKFPASEPYFFAPTNETVNVYNKPFQISQTITLATTADLRRRAAARDTLTIAGTLKYQACDDLVCYRPDSLPVSWKFSLAAGY